MTAFRDIRGEGFTKRASARATLDAALSLAKPLEVEAVAPPDAAGRCLGAPLSLRPARRPTLIARRNGFAIHAERTYGASAYDPAVLMESEVRPVSTGMELPPGFDAVAPFGAVRGVGGMIIALTVVTPGDGVAVPDGEPTIDFLAGEPLSPAALAALAVCDHHPVLVTRVPRVALIAVGRARSGPPDQGSVALTAAITRDGGRVVATLRPDETTAAVAQALRQAVDSQQADLIITLGRTGSGPDDIAPPALAAAGEVLVHGVAMRPGGSAAIGHVPGISGAGVSVVPVVALPGQPMSALVAHAAFARPTLYRLAGRRAPPFPVVTRVTLLTRKLVSEPGSLDVFPVAIDDNGMATPLGEPGQLNPTALINDGVVVVEPEDEGLAAGAEATVLSLDGPLLEIDDQYGEDDG